MAKLERDGWLIWRGMGGIAKKVSERVGKLGNNISAGEILYYLNLIRSKILRALISVILQHHLSSINCMKLWQLEKSLNNELI